MTRNNLADHLRWLLSAKPSTKISIVKAQATADDIVTAFVTEGDLLDAGSDLATHMNYAREDKHEGQFPTERAQWDCDVPSPGITARSPQRQRAMLNCSYEALVAADAPQTCPQRPADVEVLDISDDSFQVFSPGIVESKQATTTTSKKRKSDDCFTIHDDLDFNQPMKRQQRSIPEGPPPPYSTAAPKLVEDDWELDFSDATYHDRRMARAPYLVQHLDHQTSVPRPLSSAIVKKEGPMSSTTAISTIKAQDPQSSCSSPPPTSTNSADPALEQDVMLLRRFFDLKPQVISGIEYTLLEKNKELAAKAANLYDTGLDSEAQALTQPMREIHSAREAISQLREKQPRMRTLQHRKDDEFAKLQVAIQEMGDGAAINVANVANRAAKNDLQLFEADCAKLFALCRRHVQDAVAGGGRDPQSTIAASQPAIMQIRPFEDTSTRVLQTQLKEVHQPRRQTTPSAALQVQMREPQTYDDDVFDDDVFHDLDDSIVEMRTIAKSTTMPAPRRPLQEISHNKASRNDKSLVDSFAKTTTRIAQHEVSQKPASSKSRMSALNDIDSEIETAFTHPWSEDVKVVMRERFGLKGFRKGQMKAINATLSGRDAFVLMPTGGGKSLCYQLPSQVNSGKTQGVTVVISPLLSLMEDQVQHLRKLNVQAFLVNGETGKAERQHLWDMMKRTDVARFIQVLYITPEMLSKSQAMLNALDTLYRNQRFARLVIDEAHCVSQWGHDFRPDYTQIGDVRRKYPSVPVMALTATATENVKLDIIHNLGLSRDHERVSRSFNRPNLYYDVRPKGKGKDVIANIASLIREKHNKQVGIIYCLSRRNCEETAEALSKSHSIKATHYHAGMPAAEKSKVQTDWQAGRWHVIVATIAFGMGIDKANVRFVVHHSVPKTLEGYYQETGRAGRDSNKSSCYLFFSFADVTKLRRMILEGEDGSKAQKDRQLEMLQKMVQYCDNKADCRRVQVLRYFSENFAKEDCNEGCDVCTSDAVFSMQDVTELGKKAVDLVRSFDGERVTLLQCVDAFRGVKKKGTECGSFGAGDVLDRGDAERLFYALIANGALVEYQVMNNAKFPVQYLQVAPSHSRSSARMDSIQIAMRSSPQGKQKRIRRAPQTELPLSTNISSPIQVATSRRQRPGQALSRYKFDPCDDLDDTFEPAPPRQVSAKPITTDYALDECDEYHQDIINEFVAQASRLRSDIVKKDRPHNPVFSDTIFRQMAIRWTDTVEAMRQIPGIMDEQVDKYGPRYVKLVQEFHDRYRDLSGLDTVEQDPNMEIIQISSDEEGDDEDEESEDEDFGDDFDADEVQDLMTQPGVLTDEEVDVFNSKFLESQSAAMRIKPATAKSKPYLKGKRKYRSTSGGSKAGASYQRGRRANGGVKKSGARGGAGNARAKKTANSSVFSAMPT